jgi:hypothetical protein
MTEAEMKERTRILVQQAHMPSTLDLGETWLIAQAAAQILPPVATERYDATLAEFKDRYPNDVLDFAHGHRKKASRYLLLRAGSLAMTDWLSRQH